MRESQSLSPTKALAWLINLKWSYRREVWCNPAGDEICHPGLNIPIVSLHYLLIYYLDYFSGILIRVRAQFYFVHVHYLLI